MCVCVFVYIVTKVHAHQLLNEDRTLDINSLKKKSMFDVYLKNRSILSGSAYQSLNFHDGW